MKPNSKLRPDEVIAMPLCEFEQRFGFRPVDALEKYWFAAVAKRINSDCRMACEIGLLGDLGLENVNMRE